MALMGETKLGDTIHCTEFPPEDSDEATGSEYG